MLVVGGGIAGLTFAIESYRKGHHVQIVERRDEAKDFGELIVISAPALRTPSKWPGFLEKAQEYALDPVTNVFKYDGTLIIDSPIGPPNLPILPIYRSRLHQVLHEYATSLSINITFSSSAVDYFETPTGGGVILADGRELTADVVVAADGVGSKLWRLVLSEKEAPISSGFAFYRVTLPPEPLLENPVLSKLLKEPRTHFGTFAGHNAHIVVGKSDTEDKGGSEESWTNTVSNSDALKSVENWTPFVTELIKSTPEGQVKCWKLMWRDPQPKWISPLARVVQIGDVAHPFLPTSGSGATMAMEDAISLATCLALAETKIQKSRSSPQTDWDLVAKNPKIMSNCLGGWLTSHDLQDYTTQNYHDCADCIINGREFVNSNAVPGYTYSPWTVKELLDASERGGPVNNEGDWF